MGKTSGYSPIHELPKDVETFTDRDEEGEAALRLLLNAVEKRIALVPRFKQGECCKLTAMVIRDVTRYVEELNTRAEGDSYADSFVR